MSSFDFEIWERNASLTALSQESGSVTLIFGTPPAPSLNSFALSGFNTDRFDMESDEYSANFAFNVGAYGFISASIFEGNTEVVSITDPVSPLTHIFDTIGNTPTYTACLFATNPSDGTIFSGSLNTSGVVNKVPPTAPTLTFANSGFQCSVANRTIIEGDGGEFTYTINGGNPNRYESQTPRTNIPTPILIGNTQDSQSDVVVTEVFNAPSPNTNPDITLSNTYRFNFIRPLRYGTSTGTDLTQADIEDLTAWDFVGRTINPNGQNITISRQSGERFVFIYDANQPALTEIYDTINNANDISAYTTFIVDGKYRVYISTTGGAGTINYQLRT